MKSPDKKPLPVVDSDMDSEVSLEHQNPLDSVMLSLENRSLTWVMWHHMPAAQPRIYCRLLW